MFKERGSHVYKSPTLPVADVYANPNQPRKVFEPEALRELAASIKRTGLLQPVTVRPDGAGRYMIVAGERRWRAHQIAGLDTIDCIVVDITDERLAVAAIVENMQRVDITQLEEARAFQRMIDLGHTPESLAEELGVRECRVSNLLRILDLGDHFIDLLAKGVLSFKQAFRLAHLPPDLRPSLFAAIKSGQADTDQKLNAIAAAIVAQAAQTNLFDDKPPTKEEREVLSRFERLVQRLAAACNEGIRENEVVVLKKVDPHRAGLVVQQIELIRADLARIQKALLHSAAQGALLDQEAA